MAKGRAVMAGHALVLLLMVLVNLLRSHANRSQCEATVPEGRKHTKSRAGRSAKRQPTTSAAQDVGAAADQMLLDGTCADLVTMNPSSTTQLIGEFYLPLHTASGHYNIL